MNDKYTENVRELFKKNTMVRLEEVCAQLVNHENETKAELAKTIAEKGSRLKEFYKKLEDLNKEIEILEFPFDERIKELEGREINESRQVRDVNRALHLHQAKALLKKGINTRAEFATYLTLALDLNYQKKIEDVREVKHSRGKDIKVWSWKFSYDDEVAYLALAKGKVWAGLLSEKAKYIGDYTTNDVYGCKVADDIKEKSKYKSNYRTGVCMNEWLDSALVEWVGMNDTEQMNFWNHID